MGWAEYIAAFVVFFLSHSLPVRPPLRPWLVDRLGARGFTLAYSVLSIAVLAWVIGAAGRAPFVPLWGWATWQNWLAVVLMLPATLIIALAVGRPNPFSFGGGNNDQFDPAQPGIVRLSRHPLLAALALWALAHLLPNGDLAHVILFAVFAAFALLGVGLVDRRKRRELGPAWASLLDQTRAQPLSATLTARASDFLRLGLGLALYIALIWLHPVVIGPSPLP